VKLLRVLQERKFTPIGSSREVKTSTRIIAATNRNLEKMMEQGQFREDLFYRLNVMPIFLPPLRERKEDIPALIQHFVKKFSKQHQNPIVGVSPEAMELLQRYRWPGNIRELENAIERAFVVETTSQIQKTSLPETLRTIVASPSGIVPTSPTLDSDKSVFGYSGPLDFDAFKEGMEKEFIVSALKANKGRINQTVAQANIPKNTLLRKIRKFGIVVKDFTED
jgi:two-component system, NtrC family, response regulator AtoC